MFGGSACLLWIFRRLVLGGILLQSPGSKMPIIVNWSSGGEFETIDSRGSDGRSKRGSQQLSDPTRILLCVF